MNKTKNIGWQKYEDVLEKQVNSPIIDQLYKSVIAAAMNQEDLESEESSNLYGEIPQGSEEDYDNAVFTLDKDFSQEILLATNYDCWVGHTDFNLTHNIKNTLNKIEGIEVLKIFSRYRFFIGVGRMFDFSNVRKAVETELNQSKGKEIE